MGQNVKARTCTDCIPLFDLCSTSAAATAIRALERSAAAILKLEASHALSPKAQNRNTGFPDIIPFLIPSTKAVWLPFL